MARKERGFGEAAALKRSRTKCLPSLEFSCVAVPQTRARLLPGARKIIPSQGSKNHVFLSLAAPPLWDNVLQSRAGAAVPLWRGVLALARLTAVGTPQGQATVYKHTEEVGQDALPIPSKC